MDIARRMGAERGNLAGLAALLIRLVGQTRLDFGTRSCPPIMDRSFGGPKKVSSAGLLSMRKLTAWYQISGLRIRLQQPELAGMQGGLDSAQGH
jgi:hypothetical protein